MYGSRQSDGPRRPHPPVLHRPLGGPPLTPVPQLAFEAEIDRWLAAEFGWQRDPEEILF